MLFVPKWNLRKWLQGMIAFFEATSGGFEDQLSFLEATSSYPVNMLFANLRLSQEYFYLQFNFFSTLTDLLAFGDFSTEVKFAKLASRNDSHSLKPPVVASKINCHSSKPPVVASQISLRYWSHQRPPNLSKSEKIIIRQENILQTALICTLVWNL